MTARSSPTKLKLTNEVGGGARPVRHANQDNAPISSAIFKLEINIRLRWSAPAPSEERRHRVVEIWFTRRDNPGHQLLLREVFSVQSGDEHGVPLLCAHAKFMIGRIFIFGPNVQELRRLPEQVDDSPDEVSPSPESGEDLFVFRMNILRDQPGERRDLDPATSTDDRQFGACHRRTATNARRGDDLAPELLLKTSEERLYARILTRPIARKVPPGTPGLEA